MSASICVWIVSRHTYGREKEGRRAKEMAAIAWPPFGEEDWMRLEAEPAGELPVARGDLGVLAGDGAVGQVAATGDARLRAAGIFPGDFAVRAIDAGGVGIEE